MLTTSLPWSTPFLMFYSGAGQCVGVVCLCTCALMSTVTTQTALCDDPHSACRYTFFFVLYPVGVLVSCSTNSHMCRTNTAHL